MARARRAGILTCPVGGETHWIRVGGDRGVGVRDGRRRFRSRVRADIRFEYFLDVVGFKPFRETRGRPGGRDDDEDQGRLVLGRRHLPAGSAHASKTPRA